MRNVTKYFCEIKIKCWLIVGLLVPEIHIWNSAVVVRQPTVRAVRAV